MENFYNKSEDIEYMQGIKMHDLACNEEIKEDGHETDYPVDYPVNADSGSVLTPKCFDCPIMSRCYDAEEMLRDKAPANKTYEFLRDVDMQEYESVKAAFKSEIERAIREVDNRDKEIYWLKRSNAEKEEEVRRYVEDARKQKNRAKKFRKKYKMYKSMYRKAIKGDFDE